jgi:hypothetical protein
LDLKKKITNRGLDKMKALTMILKVGLGVLSIITAVSTFKKGE